MDEKLLKHFSNYHSLSEEEIEAIDATMSTVQCKKGTLLLKEGQHSTNVYFVLEGIVRHYYLVEGEEKTGDFFFEGQWVVSTTNLGDIVSNHYLECSQDCKLLVGDSTKGEDLYNRYPALAAVSRKLMNDVFLEQQAKMEAYITASPTERYLRLQKVNPELFQRIPQYQIASYIGVTPESLSRIRKRISESR